MKPIDSQKSAGSDPSPKLAKNLDGMPVSQNFPQEKNLIQIHVWRLFWHKVFFFILGYISFVPLSILLIFAMIFYGSCSFVTSMLGKIFRLIS